MALNVTLRKASVAPGRAAQRHCATASCVPAAASRSRVHTRPQALYINPRMVSACRPSRYYRAPGLGFASAIGLLNTLGSDWLRETAAVHPVEITTQDDRYELQTDCPGMSQEDISVEISPDRVLTITGARKTTSSRQSAPLPVTTATATPPSDAEEVEGTPTVPRSPSPSPASPSSASVSYRFQRSFTLPDDADVDSVSAALERGVLTLTIARQQQPKLQPRRITVK